MESTRSIRRIPLFALSTLAVVALGCAHTAAAPPAGSSTAPAGKPQLSAEPAKSTAQSPKDDKASGRAELDAALAKLREVSVFFDFDQATLTREAAGKLAAVGDVLRSHAGLVVRIEGNCDERGSEQYNLALGQRRAEAAKDYLVRMGAAAAQVTAVSNGSERPRIPGHDEAAWAMNRRDDVVPR